MSAARINRRDLFRAGGWSAAAGVFSAGAPATAAASPADNIYTRIGVRPFINCTATYTINSGTLTLPVVKEAMDEASRYSVNIDELMEKVGERLAKLLGCESGIVTAGAAAALTHATAACVAGADPEKMQQLPDLTGLRNEVVVPRQSRHVYDQAIRAVGVKMIEINSREEFYAALGRRTAMIAVLGTGEAKGPIRLEEMAQAGRKAGVPVLVDAAAELPTPPNPYLSRGADLVAYSGGKIIRGPQCAGLLLGRRDLVQAAWLNSSPHHALGRAMKVGKEEIMGLLAAVEAWVGRRDLQAEYRQWESWYAHISAALASLPGMKTELRGPAGPSPFPVLHIEWDPEKFRIAGEEIHDLLLNGEPRIKSHASGDGHSFLIRAVSMQPGDEKKVAARLLEVFSHAAGRPATLPPAPPASSIAGRWDVDVQFVAGSSRHTFFLWTDANQVSGVHHGRSSNAPLTGAVDGNQVRLRSALRYEGASLEYAFNGKINGDAIEGEVDLEEYGKARFTARRSRG